jgi:hypothetical protein
MSARILPFPVRRLPIRNCTQCGAHFRALADHHVRCSVCYWWGRALHGIKIADQAFDNLRNMHDAQ